MRTLIIGAVGIRTLGGHELGFVAAVLLIAALLMSELAARRAVVVARPATAMTLACTP